MTAIAKDNLLSLWASRARHAEAERDRLRAENERLTVALRKIESTVGLPWPEWGAMWGFTGDPADWPTGPEIARSALNPED